MLQGFSVGDGGTSITVPPWGWLVAGGLVGGGSGFTLNGQQQVDPPHHNCEAVDGSLDQCEVALVQMIKIAGECTSTSEVV